MQIGTLILGAQMLLRFVVLILFGKTLLPKFTVFKKFSQLPNDCLTNEILFLHVRKRKLIFSRILIRYLQNSLRTLIFCSFYPPHIWCNYCHVALCQVLFQFIFYIEKACWLLGVATVYKIWECILLSIKISYTH